MEEISEKWEEVEASDLGCISKEKADSDRAIGEEIRRKTYQVHFPYTSKPYL